MRLIFPFLLAFFSLSIQAQDLRPRKPVAVTMSGRVTDDKTGEPLPGASVFLPDDKLGSTADANGHYTLKNIAPGHHVVEVSHAGYGTEVIHLEMNADLHQDFQLKTFVVENQGVIVTGVAGSTTTRRSPVPVSAIRKTQLLQQASTNIIDALAKLPGISQLSTGPAISKPFIRGLGNNRIVMVNDGVRQEGQQWGDEHGAEIDEMSVGRVEVMKGPASLMYGSDALAGVIHFITNSPVQEGFIKANVLSNYQSNNGLYAIHADVAGNRNGFNWNIYGTHKSAGNYKNSFDGRVLNSGFREWNGGGYAGLNKKWGYSHLIISNFHQQLGLVEGVRDAASGNFLLFAGTPLEHLANNEELHSRTLFVPKQDVQHRRVISDNNFILHKSRLRINLAYQQNQRKEFGNPEDPSEAALQFKLNTFNYNLQLQIPEIREWHPTFGVTGMQQKNHNQGTEFLIPEYQLFDFGSFIFTQRSFQKTTFTGGVRFDHRHIHADGLIDAGVPKFNSFSRDFQNFTGSAGISYEPNAHLTLKLNLARGFRSPTLAELASNGAHEGTNRYEYGNPHLKAEKSLQADAGFDLNAEHFGFGVTAFINRMNDFIFYRKLTAVNGADSVVGVNGDLITAYQFTQQNAVLAGFEMTLDIHPHPLDWLHIENSFSMVRGQFDDAIDQSRNLPLIPPAKLVSELKGDFNKKNKYLRNVYGKLEIEKVFNQRHPFTGYRTETATAGYSLCNLGAGFDVMHASTGKTLLSIHLALNNLMDKSYQDHLSRLKYTDVNMSTGRTGVFNMGRNFSIKLNIPLEWQKKS